MSTGRPSSPFDDRRSTDKFAQSVRARGPLAIKDRAILADTSPPSGIISGNQPVGQPGGPDQRELVLIERKRLTREQDAAESSVQKGLHDHAHARAGAADAINRRQDRVAVEFPEQT